MRSTHTFEGREVIVHEGEPGAGLILALHAGGSRPEREERVMALHGHGPTVVYARGTEARFLFFGLGVFHWNAGKAEDGTPMFGQAALSDVDDIDHLRELAHWAKSAFNTGELCALVGHSAGAAMAQAAAVRTGPWTHVVAVSGGLVTIPELTANPGVRSIQYHGSADTDWPIGGGRVLSGNLWRRWGRVPPASAVAAYWRGELVPHGGGHEWRDRQTELVLGWLGVEVERRAA